MKNVQNAQKSNLTTLFFWGVCYNAGNLQKRVENRRMKEEKREEKCKVRKEKNAEYVNKHSKGEGYEKMNAVEKKSTSYKMKKLWRQIYRHRLLYLFVLPTVVMYLVFNYYPMYGIQIAFQKYRIGESFGESRFVGLANFKRFFDSYWCGTVIKNTLLLSLLNTVINFPLPIILALMFNELKNNKFKKITQVVTYAPHFISLVVMCGMIQLFLSPSNGFLGIAINEVRSWFGLENVNLLTSPTAFKWIYVLSGTWQELGWGTIIYISALSAVDPNLLEAAEIDGANKIQRIRYVNFPVLVPTIITCLILHFGGLLNTSFDKVYLLQNDGILSATETINTYVYRSGLSGGQYSFGSAVGLMSSVVNAALLIGANQITKWLSKENSMF